MLVLLLLRLHQCRVIARPRWLHQPSADIEVEKDCKALFIIVTGSHKHRDHGLSCCGIASSRHTCRSKTAEVEFRRHLPIKTPLSFSFSFCGHDKWAALTRAYPQKRRQTPGAKWGFQGVAFVETAWSTPLHISRASFSDMLFCRTYLSVHSHGELSTCLAALEDSSFCENGKQK